MQANFHMDTLERTSIKCLKQFKMKFIKPKKLAKEDSALMIIIKDFMIIP